MILVLNIPEKEFLKLLNKDFKAKSLSEFLFTERETSYMPVETDQEQIEKIHKTFLQTLIGMHERLRASLMSIQNQPSKGSKGGDKENHKS
jgi:hypothetical protein